MCAGTSGKRNQLGTTQKLGKNGFGEPFLNGLIHRFCTEKRRILAGDR